MNVINLRPVGWDDMTPRQWGIVREMIRAVAKTAVFCEDTDLLFRAAAFMNATEGYDV